MASEKQTYEKGKLSFEKICGEAQPLSLDIGRAGLRERDLTCSLSLQKAEIARWVDLSSR